MAITIKGARIQTMTMSQDGKGRLELAGIYELMSSANTVLAKQNFNGYADFKVPLSLEMEQKLTELKLYIETTINNQIGV